jgi:hypothetical protein
MSVFGRPAHWARISVDDGGSIHDYDLDERGLLVAPLPRARRRTGLTPKGASKRPPHRIAKMQSRPRDPGLSTSPRDDAIMDWSFGEFQSSSLYELEHVDGVSSDFDDCWL